MKKLRCLTALLICIIFLSTGCSSGESQSASTQLPGGGGGQQPAASASNGQQASGQGQSEGPMIEPKQLISKEEAAQLLGEVVKDGSVDEKLIMGMKVCFYPAENSSSKGYLSITVIQPGTLQQEEQSGGQSQSAGGQSPEQSGGQSSGGSSGGGRSSGSSGGSGGQSGGAQLNFKGIFEAIKASMEDLNAADTGRIGDDNFMSAQGMAIISGEYFIYVTAGSTDPAMVQQIVKAAGELAVRNLKRIQGK